MKFTFRKGAAIEGSIILVSLIVATIAGITLASYLLLTQAQTVSIYRSQTWNTCLTVGEAGIEDGLQLVNRFAGASEPELLPTWTNYVSGDNWHTVAPGILYYTRRLMPVPIGDGRFVTNVYQVWVTNLNNAPHVFAIATVPWHYGSTPVVVPTTATIGISPMLAQTDYIKYRPTLLQRKVDVKTKYDPLFIVAMAALDTINLFGNRINTDSFNSADPAYSNGGRYPFGMLDRTKDNGDVCTAAAIVDSLSIGNAKIKGRVKTGPGENTITIGPNGSVGPRAWVEGGTKGIEEGYSSTDFNVSFPNAQLPEGALWLQKNPDNKVVDGVTYQYIFDSGGYYQPTAPITGNVLINAPANDVVRLRISHNVNINGGEGIRIADTGALVRMYMEAPSFSVTGKAGVNNESEVAHRLYLFGLPTCTSITLGGNGGFCGAIYAPQANFTLGGGGSDVWDFIGASVSRTVQMNGHFNFHFDEDLAVKGPARGYIPVSWKEM